MTDCQKLQEKLVNRLVVVVAPPKIREVEDFQRIFKTKVRNETMFLG